MRALVVRLVTALLLVLLVSNGDARIAAAGVAAIAIATALAAQALTISSPASVTIGARAKQHRQLLSAQPEPSHPTTAGRPLGRAPAMGTAAA